MKSVKSKRLRAVGLFIILAALILSYFKPFGHRNMPSPAANQTKETDAYFDESRNLEKIKLDIKVKSIAELKSVIAANLESGGAQKVISNEQNSYGNYVYLVDSAQAQVAKQAISAIAVGTPYLDEKISPSSSIDLQAKLRDREADYQRLRQNNNLPSFQVSRIRQLEHEIDSLKMEISNLQTKSLTLFYIKASLALKAAGQFGSLTGLVKSFLFYVVLLLAIVALLYYGTYLLMYLLALLGVKLPSISAYLGKGYNDYAGYKGYRGYGSYGYGGSSKKRRIKRIYKNKHTSDSDSRESEDK